MFAQSHISFGLTTYVTKICYSKRNGSLGHRWINLASPQPTALIHCHQQMHLRRWHCFES